MAVRSAAARKEEAQTALSAAISMVSPLAVFSYLATDLSSTGMRSTAYFGRVSGVWGRPFGDYSRQKIADLQSGQKAARQMYDAACLRLGIPNDLEEDGGQG